MMQLSIGNHGEIVIPKKIRDALGMPPQGQVLLEIEDRSIRLSPAKEDISDKWDKRAMESKKKVSHWVYGDKLYEELF